MSEKNNNSFETTVASLFKGMDQFISSKTVVGDAITVGNTIILPLVDVSFGVGAGASSSDSKNNGAGGLGGKISPIAVDSGGKYPPGECEKSGCSDKDSGYGAGLC